MPYEYDTKHHRLGRGILHIAEFVGGTPGEYEDMGNCPGIDLTINEESLEHKSSRSGLRTKNKTTTLEVGYSLEINCDTASRQNLTRFLRGKQVGPRILGLQAADKKYALKFVEANPEEEGEEYTWYFRKVKLTPSGSLALIGDEYQAMSFTAEGEEDTNFPNSPFFDALLMTSTTT